MKYRKINRDIFYLKLKEEIDNFPHKFILLERLFSAAGRPGADLPAYLQSPEGRAAFHDAMAELISEGLITPVGSKPHTPQGLYLKYRKKSSVQKKDDGLAAQIIRNIEPPAAVDHYLKNPRDYLSDREIIAVISRFLRSREMDFLTTGERAYELFGDEKFFKGAGKKRSRGETVLRRLGLTYAQIGCQETAEPFFSFQKKDFHQLVSRKIYIVENKDTFWSCKRMMMDRPSGIEMDMLVYGEGKKIISSFQFMKEYDLRPRGDKRDTVFYFGDLDAEGINIYCELAGAYAEYRIEPFCLGYEALLEIGLQKDPVKTPKKQTFKLENMESFVKAFAGDTAAKLRELLLGGFYIPQEALSAAEIKERFGREKDDRSWN